MSYKSFTIEKINNELGLQIQRDTFISSFEKIKPSQILLEQLELYSELPLTSEKSRNERVVSPILFELFRRNNKKFSIYSGDTLNVDAKRGLNGEIDFLLSNAPKAYFIEAPIFSIVEAKKQDLDLGIPQCIAQMYASMLFNKKRQNEINEIWGCVTNAKEWIFLKLEGNLVSINQEIYFSNDIPKLLGIFQSIIDKLP